MNSSNSNTRLRQYQPIWLALKKHKTVTVRAPKHTHKRLVKAVVKEKWLDDQFKNKEGWRMMWLSYVIHEDEVTFTISYKLTELLAKDL